MLQKILFFLCLLPAIAYSSPQFLKEGGRNSNHSLTEEKIQAHVQSYVKFINRLSHGEDLAYFDVAATIFAPACKKVWNGTQIIENREDLISDLLNVYVTYGSWTISPADIIISLKEKTAVIRTFIKLDSVGDFTAIVILRFDNEGLITEINEVFNKVENDYNFETAKG